jgi:hypothetical protein
LRSVRFTASGQTLNQGTDVGCIYVAGVDLYYNDVNGNPVRITQSGSVAGTPGSIANLVAPASAQYSSVTKTFTWQSDVSTPAYLDAASIVLRNLVAGGNGLTLSPPNLASNYTLTLPQIPSVNAFLGVDTSGNITTIASQSAGITRSNLAAVGQSVSIAVNSTPNSSTPTFFIGSATATVTTSGRPVMLMAQPSTTSSLTMIIAASPSDNTHFPRFDFSYTRGSTTIATFRVGFSTAFAFAATTTVGSNSGTVDFSTIPKGYAFTPPPYMDVIGAGSYTYGMKITDSTTGSCAYTIQNISLVAYEL